MKNPRMPNIPFIPVATFALAEAHESPGFFWQTIGRIVSLILIESSPNYIRSIKRENAMLRWAVSACFALVLALNVPASAKAQNADGTWKLSYVLNGLDTAMAIVKLKTQDGKVSGEMVAASPRILKLELKSVAQDGKALKVTLTNGNFDYVFDVTVPAGKPTKLTGSFEQGTSLFPALMTSTDETMLDTKTVSRPIDCPPAQQARTMANRVLLLKNQAALSKDPEKRKDLLAQAAEADKTAKLQVPALYKEVLERFTDSPAVFEASLGLVRSAQANEAKLEEVKSWASTGANTAKAFGPRYEADFAAQVASILLGQDAYAKLAVGYARQAEKTLTAKSSASDQVRILGLVVRALKANGDTNEAKTYDVRLTKLETELDVEYMKTMPPFKGSAFTGRKGTSDKAAFMELFTGATCPPCVAADLAFDVLQKTYKPTDLVLIQYHMHIPGPDPMTNRDTIARWDYYGKAFPGQVRGVPASIFSGKPVGGGGGGVANAEKKYEAYREIINPLLEIDSGAKLTAHAVRKGDRIDINVNVDKLVAPGSDKKLRILLAEETVRYAGSNKIRLHHNVVRAFPGGVEGKSLMVPASKHTASIDVAELRGSLNKYLTEFEATGRSFANPARPLDMENLRVIAFIQDEMTHEILQAVQVEVEKK